jgi:hypothetical protein
MRVWGGSRRSLPGAVPVLPSRDGDTAHAGTDYVQQDEWVFQSTIPSREARYTLQLPPDWEYKVSWMNYPEVKPVGAGDRQWQWVISDVKALRTEDDMPPWRAIAGQMLVRCFLQSVPANSGAFRIGQKWEPGTRAC